MSPTKAWRMSLLLIWLPWGVQAAEPAQAPEQPAAQAATRTTTQAPIQIEADSAEYHDASGISTYKGNVVLTRGDSRIEANQVEVRSQDNRITQITAIGAPIRFQQITEGQAPIAGKSLRLEYNAETEVLLLLDEAELQRGSDHFSGSRIQYDRRKERVSASTGEKAGERVRITLQPRASEGDSAPAKDAQ